MEYVVNILFIFTDCYTEDSKEDIKEECMAWSYIWFLHIPSRRTWSCHLIWFRKWNAVNNKI